MKRQPSDRAQRPRRSGDRASSPLFAWRYLSVAAAIAGILFTAYFYPYPEGGAVATTVRSYLAAYARMVGAIVALFDPRIAVAGATIQGPLFSMQIVRTCDAMEVNILLVAALAAFPMPIWRRVVSVPLSVVLLVLANILRLCVLYWLGAHEPAWFDRAHQTLAPLGMVAGALAIFLIATRGQHGSSWRHAVATTPAP